MNSKSNSYEEENIARGCLKLNNKIYPVYDGLNTIGRSPEAIVNLKHLNISKQHAVITITDEGVHYISDFNSSNGTVLDDTKLNPLKLHRLDNGCSIKFADIFCTYKTLGATEKLTNNGEESQILDDNFYAAGTQTIELPEVHEIGINEMPTQVMSPKAIGFNEMDTDIQIFDDTSGDSIDFATMQKAESQMISLGTGLRSPSKVNSSDLLKSDDDEPPLSQIRPVKTARKKIIESDSDTDDEVEHVPEKNMSRYVISDDSETDIENEEEKDIDEADVVIPMTQDVEQKTSEEPAVSSLAVSEQINNGPGEQTNEEMPTDETVGSIKDAENEDEVMKDAEKEDEVIKDAENEDERGNENETLADNLPSTEEIDVLHYEAGNNEDEETIVLAEGKIEEDNVAPPSEDKTKDNKLTDFDFLDRPIRQIDTEFMNSMKDQVQKDGNFEVDQNLQRGEELEISKSSNQTSEAISEEGRSEKIEDAFDQPTQQVDFDFVNHGEMDLEKSEESKIVEDQDNVVTADKLDFEDHDTPELYLQSTQPLDKNGERSKDKEEAELLPPTQALRLLHGDGEEEEEAGMLNDGSKTKGDKDTNFFQQSTQSLEDLLGNEKTDSSVLEEKEDQVEMCLPPTQSLELLHGEEVSRELKNDSSAINKDRLFASKDKEDEDVFLSPTKALDHLLSAGSPGIGKNRSKTVKEKLSISGDIEEDDSFILPPTQAMELLHKDDSNFNQVEDQLAEIFTSQNDILLGTQQLVDVLETTHDEDVVDDSFAEDFGRSTRSKSWIFKKPEPISVDLVKEILEEDIKSLDNKKEVKSVSEENADDKLEEQSEKERKGSAKNNKEEIDGEKIESKRVRKEETKDAENIGRNRRETRKQSMVRLEKKEGKDGEKKKDTQEDDDEKKVGRKEVETSNKEVQRNVEKEEDKKGQKNKKKVGNETNEKDLRIGEVGRRSTRNQVSDDDKKKSGAQVRKEKTTEIDTGDLSLEIKKKKEKSSSSDGRMEGKEERKEKRQVTNKKDQSEDQTNVETRRSRRQQNIANDQKSKLKVEQGSDSTDNNSQESGENKRRTRRTKDSQESTVEVDKSESTEEGGNSRRQQNIANDQKPKLKVEQGSDSTDNNSQEGGENKRRTRRTKDSQESTVEVDKSDSNEEGGNSRRSKRKENTNSLNQKQLNTNARVNPKKKESQSSNEEETPNTRSTSKRKKDDKQENKETSPIAKKRATVESEEGNKKNDKENDEGKGTQKKRSLKMANVDSGDEFEAKIPKLQNSPDKTTPTKSKTPVEPTRKSRRNTKKTTPDDDDSVIVASSSSSSSIQNDGSSMIDESVLRRRRLSANSRRLKKEEEMKGEKKEEEIKGEKKTVTRRTTAAQASPAMLSTPERFKRQTKPKVVFTMMDNPELESLIRQLGGSVVDTVDACTVLVTESVKRSQKLLCAVGQGKPICSPKWLQACKKAYSFVDPWNYILVDQEAEKKWNFSLRESLNRSAKTKALQNHTFQLIVNNAADVLKGAIEACGGKCVTRNLAKSGTDNLIIVSSENNRSKYSKILKQNPEIKVVEAEAIFDGTLRQEFRFNKHLLS